MNACGLLLDLCRCVEHHPSRSGAEQRAGGLGRVAHGAALLDHVVHLPSGEAVYNPMRVVPVGVDAASCEVVFTVRQRPGMADAEFEADVAAVAADLETLRRLLEGH